MQNNVIVIERVFDAGIDRVWKAITDKNEMKSWYFKLDDFKPEPGFKFSFRGGEDDGNQYLHLCEVIEVIKEKKLSYTWTYDGKPGNSLVTLELSEQDNKTLLKLTHTGVETFAAAGPDFQTNSFIQGWTYIVHTALKNFISLAAVSTSQQKCKA